MVSDDLSAVDNSIHFIPLVLIETIAHRLSTPIDNDVVSKALNTVQTIEQVE